MRKFAILSVPILLMACASGVPRTNAVAPSPRPVTVAPASSPMTVVPARSLVTNVEFSVTTSPQERFGGFYVGIGNFTSPTATLTNRSGSPITLTKGFVFLLVKAQISPSAGQRVVGGTDFYLIDGGGEKNIGFYSRPWMIDQVKAQKGTVSHEWGNGDTSWEYTNTDTSTEVFLYAVKKDRITGSVFHFAGAEFRVLDHPPVVADRRVKYVSGYFK